MLFVGRTLSGTSWQAQAVEQFRFACRPTVLASAATCPRQLNERRRKQSVPRLAMRGSRKRRQQARHQTAALGETVDLDMFVERVGIGAANAEAVEGRDAHRASEVTVGA